MNVDMTEARRNYLERRAKMAGYTKGHVAFQTCGVCGLAAWVSTTTRDRNDKPYECLEVSEWVQPGPNGCQACMTVQMRAPEVFTWVLNAIEWSHSRPKLPG